MKSVEKLWLDEIRQDKLKMKEEAKIKQKMKEENQLKGMVVTPIRNTNKLRKLSKKQWKSIVKMSVDIKKPKSKNSLRNGKVDRVMDSDFF